MSGTAAAFLLLSAAPAIAPVPLDTPAIETEETEVLEAGTDRDKRMTVPVEIGDNGPFDFVIDTGSQRTVISTTLAGQLSLEAGPSVNVVSIAGVDRVATVHVDQIKLGKREFFGIRAPLFEADHIGAHGMVGTDSLQDQRVLIDFDKKRMEIGTKSSLGGNRGYEIVVTARKLSGQLVLTRAVIDGVRVAVIIDTGAAWSIGNRALERALARRGNSAQVTLTSVTGHEVVADIGFARTLKLREYDINNVLLAYTDSPAFAELGLDDKPALFLGMRELRLFKRVAIDFGRRRVLFDVPRT